MMLHLLKVVLAFYGLAFTYHTEKFFVILTALDYKSPIKMRRKVTGFNGEHMVYDFFPIH